MGATDLSVFPQRQVVFPETTFKGVATTDVPLRVQAVSGQTGNITEWQMGDSSIFARFAANGALVVSGPTGVGIFGTAGVENRITNGALRVETGATNRPGVVVRGMASQTANLMEYQDSAGTVIGTRGPAGQMTVGPGQPYNSRIFYANNGTSSAVATTIEIGYTPASTTFAGLEIYRSGTSAVNDGSSVVFSAKTDTGVPVEYAGINGRIESSVAASYSGYLAFLVSSNASQRVERMRLSSGGVVSVFGNGYALYGPNSTWGATLAVGGNGTLTNDLRASVTTTNGNLHLDGSTTVQGGGRSGIYLNWYATQTQGTYFGNGGAGQVGRVDGAGAASFVSVTSTSRLDTKRNIQRVLETGPDDEKLMSLSAVKYNSVFSQEGADPLHSFVAEEVEEVMPEIVSHDENGEIVGINLTSLVTILTTQVQNLTARVRELEAK